MCTFFDDSFSVNRMLPIIDALMVCFLPSLVTDAIWKVQGSRFKVLEDSNVVEGSNGVEGSNIIEDSNIIEGSNVFEGENVYSTHATRGSG
jgi:hypothetical protein